MTINYSGDYSVWQHALRTINPFQKNREDLDTAMRLLASFERIKDSLEIQDAHSGITDALTQENKNAELFIKRIGCQWFVSKKVKRKARELQKYTTAYKIAKQQHIPFTLLANDEALTTFIEKNHLHHKIVAQHHEMGLRVKVEDKKAYFPVATDLNQKSREAKTEWIAWQTLQKELVRNPALKSGKTNRIAFLTNGLELHDPKNWQTLRPLYRCNVKENTYVHTDTLTGKTECVGEVGKNYVQIISVLPWGYNPKGGALFGHTWLRFAIDGKIYHIGIDLSGKILNPDFMASVPMQAKHYTTSAWAPLNDDAIDIHGNSQSERIMQKIEALQYFLTHRKKSDSPYTDVALEFYRQLRHQNGGTCTSAAAMVYRELSGVDYLEKSRPLAARIVFNSCTRTILDVIWRLTPKFFVHNVVQPVQIITRGATPERLAAKMT